MLVATDIEVVEYTYNALGNILETLGTMAATLGKTNALTYRGYVYDNETELYYLQSRYYNPEMGRFLNADALVATGQGLLGNNMFAYCNNDPVGNYDPNGNRLVGIGFQLEVNIGGVSVGVEIVVYFDSRVCGDADYQVVLYTYGGYELTDTQMDSLYELINISSVAAFITGAYELKPETAALLSTGASLFLQIMAGITDKGGAVTGAVFVIDGYDNFNTADDYSGEFTSITASGTVGSKTGAFFLATSETCHATGIKYGRAFLKGKNLLSNLVSHSISLSTTYYSDPYILLEGAF